MGRASLKKWAVAGAEQVLDYVGRYTHRIAISNDRLVSLRDGQVTFRRKDRAYGNQKKLLTLDAEEFLRRFLLHVLSQGLVRIRHYGFLANAARHRLMGRCRELLNVSAPARSTPSETWQQTLLRLTGKDVTRCPNCREGTMSPRAAK